MRSPMMNSLNTYLSEKNLTYDGTQLSPHWIYKNFELLGDSVISFVGPADVPTNHMVDLVDVKKDAPIYGPLMLHFIGEWFLDSLDYGILLQHLFACEIYELLWERGIQGLSRNGNDIFVKSRKLSVSIATRSPVSLLMHTGLNIRTENTPLPTSGLEELDIEPLDFSRSVLNRFRDAWENWHLARVKVCAR